MSRFGEDQDPLFKRLNSSISFDRRLAPFDVEQSRAHARALRRLEVLDEGELAEILAGLDAIEAELAEGRFPFGEDDEDIHMAIERRLIELAGPVGGKLHTARSRNDQVATDLALLVRSHAAREIALLEALMETLVELAEGHRDWAAPAYTHLQRAQPVYLGHHLLAYFWMFFRDARRFFLVAESTSDMPAGSGALAGLNWDLDREGMAAELGFARPHPNSLDAVSNRDFALDYLYAASVCAMHLSRLGSEIVLWSSSEFGFCAPSDAFASGSSIMPQKKNPDAAELLRGKAPRVAASLASLLGTMHALPLAYSKDLQEDKEPLFDAIDNLELCLEAATPMLAGLHFDRDRLAEASSDEMLAATDLADALVGEGVPFRDAHGVVAGLVRTAVQSGKRLSELSDAEMNGVPAQAREPLREALREGGTLEAKVSAGGTSTARLDEQLEQARAGLGDLRR
ncbi:MAG TPA: argininosuccinate lyase [Solirubrobacterales bacterium]|jgi:argininosuccinate lyase|nr:argininosuccinate lyase [Solirubrobacterales bacterium]